jgi:hypothetical protein
MILAPCARRWDGCFIRLLDGMLQAGALGSSDYQLRIPTKIRHLEIFDASPPLPAGSQGARAIRLPKRNPSFLTI